MSNTASTTTNPGHQPDPLLRGGAFIDPGTKRSSAAGENRTSSSAEKPRRSTPRPPEPGSEIASWLPDGWLVEERWRTSGATAGTVDKYYFDPKSGRRFRSKKEVQYYLETGTVRQHKKRGAENSDNSSEGPGSQKKKSGTKPPSVFDPSNVPEAVEWCLTNATEDGWTPSIRGKEVTAPERGGWTLEFASRTANSSSKNGF